MRQTAPRRPPEKIAVTTGTLRVGAGDHLDLGMIVSVHCPGAAPPNAAAAQDGLIDTPDDTGTCFTEH